MHKKEIVEKPLISAIIYIIFSYTYFIKKETLYNNIIKIKRDKKVSLIRIINLRNQSFHNEELLNTEESDQNHLC